MILLGMKPIKQVTDIKLKQLSLLIQIDKAHKILLKSRLLIKEPASASCPCYRQGLNIKKLLSVSIKPPLPERNISHKRVIPN